MDRYDAMEAQVTNAQAQASASSGTLGKFSLLIIFLFTVLLIGGMIADKQRVALAFICGVSFFTVFGGMVIFVLSGQLAAMVINYQNQKTVRMFNTMQFSLYDRAVPQVELVQPDLLPEQAQSLPRFVPAVPQADEQLKLSAYDFVLGLFNNGQPDPERILPEGSNAPGQVQAKKPRPEVVEYLLGLGMISVNSKSRMLFFNVQKYSTLRKCQQAIKHGMPIGG